MTSRIPFSCFFVFLLAFVFLLVLSTTPAQAQAAPEPTVFKKLDQAIALFDSSEHELAYSLFQQYFSKYEASWSGKDVDRDVRYYRGYFRNLFQLGKYLEALEVAGAIERIPGRARGIRVLRTPEPPQSQLSLSSSSEEDGLPDDALRLPVLGRVAAGAPIGSGTDGGDVERHLRVEASLFKPRPDYLLRVQGDSMIDDGILDGDLVGVRRQPTAENGQTVVARLDGEITIKRLQHDADSIRLLPRNPAYALIVVDPNSDDFAIEGLFVGLLRTL